MTRSRRPPPAKRLRDRWTVSRATSTGIVCGLLALLLAAPMGPLGERLLYPYAALLTLTAVCGLSILGITFADMRARQRGAQVRPIRAFDAIAGVVLAAPSLYALWRVWPALAL